MKKWKLDLKRPNLHSESKKDRIALHGGAYSLIVTVVVLAILILVNVFAKALPEKLTKFDISSSKLYSITSNTKTVVNHLKDDVTLYWIVQSGQEDDIVENLLGKYESLSDHIKVVKKNPDVYPTFAEKYTSEKVQNNSIVVECGEKSKYIGLDDIYLQETDLSTYSKDSSFDGEGAITSAIDYVVSEDQPQVYVLEGHGELPLPKKFSDQMEKANMAWSEFSLVKENGVPDDADLVLIYGIQNDISEEEADLLKEYVKNGGKMFVMAGPVEGDNLDNLYSILGSYGVQKTDGVVVEGDNDHYAFQQPHILMPNMEEDKITKSLIDEKYYPIMPLSLGVTITEEASDHVKPLLKTSIDSYNKAAGYNLETYEKEEGDEVGPYVVALKVDSTNEGQMIWFTSSYFLDDLYNSYSSGANVNLAMNCMYSMIGENDAMAIRSKSLNYDYLTISESASSFMKVVMIGIFPILYLGAGIAVVVERRRKRNESN